MAEKIVGAFGRLPEREKEEVTLPSGRQVTVLETTGREEKILSQLAERKDYSAINNFLVGVTENLDGVEGKVDPKVWQKALSWDRTFVLVIARRLTHGNTVTYHYTCPKCDEKSEHEIDLNAIIDSLRPYPERDQRVFSVNLGGNELFFELSTGETEAKIAAAEHADLNVKLASMKLWEETEMGPLPVSVENLKSKYLAELRKAVKSHEAYMDTTTVISCPCGKSSQRVDVVASADFLFPNVM